MKQLSLITLVLKPVLVQESDELVRTVRAKDATSNSRTVAIATAPPPT